MKEGGKDGGIETYDWGLMYMCVSKKENVELNKQKLMRRGPLTRLVQVRNYGGYDSRSMF